MAMNRGSTYNFSKNQSKGGKKTLCIHWITTELDWNWGTITSLWSICPKSKSWKWFQTLKYVCTMFFLRCLKNTEARRRVASSTATVIKFSWRSVGNSCSWISLLDPKGRIILFWGTKTAQLPGRPFFYIIWCIIVWGTFLTLLLFYSIGCTLLMKGITFLVFLV